MGDTAHRELNWGDILLRLSLCNWIDMRAKPTQSPATVSPRRNELLAAIPRESWVNVFPALERVALPSGKVLYEPGHEFTHVYFPIDSIIALLGVTQTGFSTRIAVVGKEGLLGAPLFMGSESTSSRAIVQFGGHAFRIPAALAKGEFVRHGMMISLVLRYIQVLITQMAQTAVCNRHHCVDQQLCRWLLETVDRLPSNSFTITQELIGRMLGVRRESVTDAAGKLQELGVISYSRGFITVLDRARLENLSCECYRVVRRETDRLIGFYSAAQIAIKQVRHYRYRF